MGKKAFLAAAVLCGCMNQALGDETRTAVSGEPRPVADIAELSWLAGAWSGVGISGPAREVYSPPTGGVIVGHFVQQRDEGVWFSELMAIRPDGTSITYCLRHFNADLTAWEEKNEVQCFPLIARERDTWYFDGLTVRRKGDDELVTAVRVVTESDTKEYMFQYRRSAERH
jgi:hypothetical protein